ncbi:lycopene cyclase domain-containing protein [Sanguibacter suaedae]|uniref:Lycopene cyclase domain-containing protein n=1 Tax=Sanguibacter suaedae TaxID=2795737 RepID=A0A934IAW3_9MICO|nr:lycopene cyclase domain-containing protein [Sanguibacter suaedae]MBI9114405.1 lycopene cyclase domain-containing protein [Sanguibacter suaedae]
MTYLLLNAVFLVVVLAVVAGVRLRARRTGPPPRPHGRPWWLLVGIVMAVLVILTVVFDSVMIAADLFRFSDEHMTGLRVWLAPVEDLAWPVAAALLLPTLWDAARRTTPPEDSR